MTVESATSRTGFSRRDFLAAAAAVGVTAACSPVSKPAAGSLKDADDGGKAVTMSFWKPPGQAPEPENKYFKDLVAEFGREHQQDAVKHLLLPWEDAFTKLTAAFGSGAPPDISYLTTVWVSQFATAGGLAPVTDIDPGLDLSGYNARALDAVKTDGKLYGVPWYSGRVPLAMNEAVWEKAGRPDLPATYADLAEFVKLLTFDKSGRPLGDKSFDRKNIATYGMVWPGMWDAQANFLWNYLWAYGADYVSEDGKNIGFDSDGGREALRLMRQMQESGAATPISLYADGQKWNDLLWTGRGGVYWVSPPTPETFKEHPNTRLKVLDLPSGPAGQFMQGGVGYLAVSAKCKYPQTALDFIKLATRDEAVKRYLQQTLYFPIRDTIGGDIFSTVKDEQSRQFLLDTLEQAKYLRLTRPLPYNGEEYVAGEINNYVSGQKDLERMIKDASKQIGIMAKNAGL